MAKRSATEGLRWLCLVFLVIAPVVACAASKDSIPSNLIVVDGKLLFCQSDRSLTILDVSTGKVLLRDPAVRCTGEFVPAGNGALLSEFGYYRLIDVAQSVAKGRMTTRFEYGFPDAPFGPCRASLLRHDYFVCAHLADTFVDLRSLPSGKLVWQYNAHDDTADIAENKGRILLTLGAFFLPHELVLIRADDANELLRQPIAQDGHHTLRVREFTDDRIVVQGSSPDCKGTNTRVIDLKSPSTEAAIDDCKRAWIATPSFCPAGSSCVWLSRPDPSPRIVNANREQVLLKSEPNGTLITGFPKAGVWHAFHRQGGMEGIGEINGKLLIASGHGATGVLESLSFQSGKPEWMYIFGQAPESPIKGTVLLPQATAFGVIDDEAALDHLPSAPVIVDPLAKKKASQ